MNWTHVILAAYIGAVIAAVVGLMRKKGWVGKTGGIVLTLVAIVGWNLFDVHYLIPRGQGIQGQTEEQKFDAAFATLPIYPVLKEQDPAFLTQLRTKTLAMRKEGKPLQQIIDAIQVDISKMQIQRLQTAPDANVVAFMQVNMQQTALIQKKSDDDCFRFLFPEVKGGINPVHLLPKEVIQRRMDVDAQMMRAAYGPEKHTVSDEERQQAQRDLQPIIQALAARYGSDLNMMASPAQAVGKESVACNITQDLWRNALLLPADRAAGIIRLAMAAVE